MAGSRPKWKDLVFSGPADEPTSPTDAQPGSEEKVDILARRYEEGVKLWHDLDRGTRTIRQRHGTLHHLEPGYASGVVHTPEPEPQWDDED